MTTVISAAAIMDSDNKTYGNRSQRTSASDGNWRERSNEPQTPKSPTLPDKYIFPLRVPTQHLLTKLAHAGKSFSTQLRVLTQEIILPSEDLYNRDLIVRNLGIDLAEIFEGARLRLFGSSANAIGTRGSDMDAIVVLPPKPKIKFAELDDLLSPPLGHLRFEELRKMQRPLTPKFLALLTHSDMVILLRKFLVMKYWRTTREREQCEFNNIVAIHGARIPIVRLIYKSGLEVDISLSHDQHPLSLCNTGLLRLLAEMDHRFKIMCIVLRRWQEEHGLTKGHGGLNNYALTLLVMHFLQHNGDATLGAKPPVAAILPSLPELAKTIGIVDATLHATDSNHVVVPPFTGDGVVNPAVFDRESWTNILNHEAMGLLRSTNSQSISELLYGFFRFYARYVPLLTHVIRTHSGESINTVEFFRQSWQGYLQAKRSGTPTSSSILATTSVDEGDTVDDPFHMPRANAFYVYDPFLPTYNTAKNLSIQMAVQVQATLEAAVKLFDDSGPNFANMSVSALLNLDQSVDLQEIAKAKAAAYAAEAATATAAAAAAAAAKAAVVARGAAASPADPIQAAKEAAVVKEENRYRHQQLDYQQKQVEFDTGERVWSFTLTLGYLKKRSLIEALYAEPNIGKDISSHLQVACKFILAVLRDVYCFDHIRMLKDDAVDKTAVARAEAFDEQNFAELNSFLTKSSKNRDVDAGIVVKPYYNILSLMPTVHARTAVTSNGSTPTVNGAGGETTAKSSAAAVTNGSTSAADYADNNQLFEELVGLRRLLSVQCRGSQAMWSPNVRSGKLVPVDQQQASPAAKEGERPWNVKEKSFEREIHISKAIQQNHVTALLSRVNSDMHVKVDVFANFDTLLVQVSSGAAAAVADGVTGNNNKQNGSVAAGSNSGHLEEFIRHLRVLCFDFIV